MSSVRFPLFASAIAVAAALQQLPLSAAPASLRQRLEASSHPLAQSPGESVPLSPGLRAPPATFGVRVSPLDFGADPLGRIDSSDALQACVSYCQNYSVAIDALGHFTGDYSFGNGRYIANAGGCEIDLGGGEFLLSRPVLIPEYLGNLRLGHGSLIADDTPGVFPASSFLLVVGVEGSCKVPQGSCNVDLGFPELFLDGRHVASGLQINNVMGAVDLGNGGYAVNTENSFVLVPSVCRHHSRAKWVLP